MRENLILKNAFWSIIKNSNYINKLNEICGCRGLVRGAVDTYEYSCLFALHLYEIGRR